MNLFNQLYKLLKNPFNDDGIFYIDEYNLNELVRIDMSVENELYINYISDCHKKEYSFSNFENRIIKLLKKAILKNNYIVTRSKKEKTIMIYFANGEEDILKLKLKFENKHYIEQAILKQAILIWNTQTIDTIYFDNDTI